MVVVSIYNCTELLGWNHNLNDSCLIKHWSLPGVLSNAIVVVVEALSLSTFLHTNSTAKFSIVNLLACSLSKLMLHISLASDSCTCECACGNNR